MHYVPILFSAVGLFLSLWIIVPAPTFSLLPLGVGAPEVSPWLIVVNAIALLLGISQFDRSWWNNAALICSLLGLCLSWLPLIQLPAANRQFQREMETVLGADYLTKIPPTLLAKMRSQPFVLADVFRGIPPEGVRIQRGVVFANPDGVELKLNLYRPLSTGKYPTLLVIYGGAWRAGSPDEDEIFSRYIAAQGYSVIALDYRHAPQYKFPTQLEDIQTAIKYIQENARDLEVDCDRLAVMGRSAGGHLATLAAYQPDATSIPIKAVISYYSPVDLPSAYQQPPVPDPINTREVLDQFIGGSPEVFPELYKQASPINYPQPNLPLSLLIYPQRDHLVEAKYGRVLYQKLRSHHNTVILLEIPWAEHSFDKIFAGIGNQLVLYYTERFLAWAIYSQIER